MKEKKDTLESITAKHDGLQETLNSRNEELARVKTKLEDTTEKMDEYKKENEEKINEYKTKLKQWREKYEECQERYVQCHAKLVVTEATAQYYIQDFDEFSEKKGSKKHLPPSK